MAWTTPRTWVTSETVTATLLNTHVRDNLNAIGSAWTTYTGGDTNLTIGNGTLTKRYMQAGNWVQFSIELTFGSTTSFSAAVRFGLPVTPRITTTGSPIGRALLVDNSAVARRMWSAGWVNTDAGVAPLDDTFTGVNSTTPWTWATSDIIVINGSYETA